MRKSVIGGLLSYQGLFSLRMARADAGNNAEHGSVPGGGLGSLRSEGLDRVLNNLLFEPVVPESSTQTTTCENQGRLADAGPCGRLKTCVESGSIGVDDVEAEGVPQGRIHEVLQEKRTPLNEDECITRGDRGLLGLLANGGDEGREQFGAGIGRNHRGETCLDSSPRRTVGVEAMRVDQEAQEDSCIWRIEGYKRRETRISQ